MATKTATHPNDQLTETTVVPPSMSTSSKLKIFDRNILQDFLIPTISNKEVMLHCDIGKYSLIYDKYPKARIHLLIVINEHFIDAKTVKELNTDHVIQLSEIHRFAQKLCQEIETIDVPVPSSLSSDFLLSSPNQTILNSALRILLHNKLGTARLKIGFHAIPSLYPLHIHIISDDMESETMKNKKHWNSFTTSFFVELDFVMNLLRDHAQAPDASRQTFLDLLPFDNRHLYDHEKLEALLKDELRCNKCNVEFRTIPQLKGHLQRQCNSTASTTV